MITFSIKLIPSIKHPDSQLTIIHLLAACLLLVIFLAGIKNMPFSDKSSKGVKMILAAGFISGILVYGIKMLEEMVMNTVVLDVVSSDQYPFHLLFITPLFGLKYLLDISYADFPLLISVMYVLIFTSIIAFKKVDAPIV